MGRGILYICSPCSDDCFQRDFSFWSDKAQTIESSWSLLAPSLCLKNRPALDSNRDRLFIQPVGSGPIQPSQSVVFAPYQNGMLVGNTTRGECFFLQDIEAEIWLNIVRLGVVEEVVAALSAEYAVDSATLKRDVSTFKEQLKSAGLIVETDERAAVDSR